MKVNKKIYILYKNGKEDAIEIELEKEGLERVAEVINEAFKRDAGGVIRLHDENQSNFISISEIVRVKIL